MEVPESFERYGKLIPLTNPTLKFAEIHDPEERRMMTQARLAHELRRELPRKYLDQGRQSCSADSSGGKSNSSDSFAPVFGGPRPPKELLMQEEHKISKLTDVNAIHPMVGGGSGTLEAYTNGFMYTVASGSRIVFMNANVDGCSWRPGDGDEWPPLLLFHLNHPITVDTKEMKDVQFSLIPTSGEQAVYSEDLNWASSRNEDLKNFVHKVKDTQWNCKATVPITPVYFQALEECEFAGVFPTGKSATVALTNSAMVVLVGQPFFVVPLRDIQIVNLALVEPEMIHMTVVFEDLKRDVLEIGSIPSKFLTAIKDRLNFVEVKYYVNRESLNWKMLVREIAESPERFVHDGGWESLCLEDSRTLSYYPDAESNSDSDLLENYGPVIW